MKKSLLALSLLSALTLSAAASAAEGVSYNYVEGGYTATNLKDAPDSDGWGLNGSVDFQSSGVTGWPSANFASGRIVNSTQERSGGVSTDSASRP